MAHATHNRRRSKRKRKHANYTERSESDIHLPISLPDNWQKDWVSEGEEEGGRAPSPTPPRKKKRTREERTEELKEFIARARNANTHAAYTSGWRQFARWAVEVENPQRKEGEEVDPHRPAEADVAAYVWHMVEVKETTIGTVHSALAAIADHIRYEVTDTYNPCRGKLVGQMVAALTPRAKPAKRKREVTWTQLREIAGLADATEQAQAERDTAMILLAYHAFLRGSEVARMKVGDITFGTEEIGGERLTFMKVHVNRLAKNDKERIGHERLIAEKEEEAEWCVVRRMRRYLRGRRDKDEPLFPTARGEQMSPDTPRGRLKTWLELIGVEEITEYGFHSLRAAGATDAARAGAEEREIKAHGNWKSDAVKLYIRQNTGDRLRISKLLGSA